MPRICLCLLILRLLRKGPCSWERLCLVLLAYLDLLPREERHFQLGVSSHRFFY